MIVWLPPLTLLAAFLVAALQGLTVESVVAPLATWGVLMTVASRWTNFRAGLQALAAMMLFSTAWPLLIDGVATLRRPLADRSLAEWDQWLGLTTYSAPSAWHPLFAVAYESAVLQTWIVVLYLGMTRNKRLGRFVTGFMTCALLITVGFALWPAEGTFHGDGASYLERIRGLRDGTIQALSWQRIEGIVTYPSFHAAWAVLLVAACYRTWLFWPAVVLNVLMVLSTVPAGQHYYIDVMAGLVLAASVLVLIRCSVKSSHADAIASSSVDRSVATECSPPLDDDLPLAWDAPEPQELEPSHVR
jgi:membrane-associated phospholipid phosphatase